MLAFIVSGTLTEVFRDPIDSFSVQTPFGETSAPISVHSVAGEDVLVLERHGENHVVPAHRVNYRANIWALREAKATHVVATATTGSVDPALPPGQFVVPDQIIDYTQGRIGSFETAGIDEHFDFSLPFTNTLRESIISAIHEADFECIDGGIYACTQGPRFETAAEIDRCRRDGCNVVGMTLMPEAPLARQIALEYAAIALVMNPGAGIAGDEIDLPGSIQFTDDATMPLREIFRCLIHRFHEPT